MSALTQCRILLYVLKQSISQPTFNQFNPDDVDHHYRYPNKMNSYLLQNQPVFFAPKLSAWMCSLNQRNTIDLAKNFMFSHNFNHWKFSPKPIPEKKQNGLQKLISRGLLAMPPEDHKRIRRLIQPAFLPKNLHKLEAPIVSSIDVALDNLPQSINLVDLTKKIPLTIMAKLLHVPEDHENAFEGLATMLLATYNPMIKSDPALAASGLNIVRQLVEDCRGSPKNDFMSDLVQKADEGGDQLSIDEVMAFIAAMLTAARDSITNYLNFAVQACLSEPGLYQALKHDLSLVPQAITEAARLYPLSHAGLVRFATQDTEISGVKIKKGDMIRLNIGAANLDPSVFPDPFTFDFRRENLQEVITFGAGSHYCPFASFTRSIAVYFIQKFITTYPYAVISVQPFYQKDFIFRKMIGMQIKLY